jgi:hypothetical protein
MNRQTAGLLTLALVLHSPIGNAQLRSTDDRKVCSYYLETAKGETGAAKVTIKGTVFVIQFWRATPNKLYTIWTDHRNRATGKLAPDYPNPETTDSLARGVAPTFATTAGVTSGMGLDPNAVVTDRYGNAKMYIVLDHELLKAGDSPVVGAGLAMQAAPGQKIPPKMRPNRVGGGWMRVYEKPKKDHGASAQKIDRKTRRPLVERSTAQGITVVRHEVKISHGHTPGVGGVDHMPGFNGDFPKWCFTRSDDDAYDDDDDD